MTKEKSFWNGRKVLITGHSGFKGSWLVLLLSQLGAEVSGYSLMPETGEFPLFEKLNEQCSKFKGTHSCFGDICDLEKLRSFVLEVQPEIVFHLAAQPLVRLSYKEPLKTWKTNVEGSLNILEALKCLNHKCAVVMITTDKVYHNEEWIHGYRENDKLGGKDPYSSSKAAAEIAISSWRESFCGNLYHQTSNLHIASARSGNVIGGGDWSLDRILPDSIRALSESKPILIRNPLSTRPWQHVLEPLSGYLKLAENLALSNNDFFCSAYNFGPEVSSNRSVQDLVEKIVSIWPGKWSIIGNEGQAYESNLLHLNIDKSHHHLDWSPKWNFDTTVNRTIAWYKNVSQGDDELECCLSDIQAYFN